jgi:aspartyl-tRNA(Asn)/glutamyl-tRNA(Gln) amidotransferase subunit B
VPQRVCKSYKVLVGLEIHVQLATQSKMFTSVANGATNFGAEPNSLVDEQVLGLPGTLPVLNKRAVEYSIMVGLALGCKIARHTKWDRKSYYYPDLPKNYQISQYDLPLCNEGLFEVPFSGEVAAATGNSKGTLKVRIRRAHLEEDAGKLLHDAPGGYPIPHSIVDLNRAGTPLLEIVTEPDLSTPEEVRAFAQELQLLVQFLKVSEGQMQMGHMRFEPNINVHITDAEGNIHKTAITEIKNLNSFSVLERATAYEIRRQISEWENTGSLGKKST